MLYVQFNRKIVWNQIGMLCKASMKAIETMGEEETKQSTFIGRWQRWNSSISSTRVMSRVWWKIDKRLMCEMDFSHIRSLVGME